jgi:hypothetical protein
VDSAAEIGAHGVAEGSSTGWRSVAGFDDFNGFLKPRSAKTRAAAVDKLDKAGGSFGWLTAQTYRAVA